nr:hypothetical protein CFP56_51745 [Quercus suber]
MEESTRAVSSVTLDNRELTQVHRYLLFNFENIYQFHEDELCWGRDDVEGMTINAFIIGERDLHEMDNLDDCEFIDDESNDEDDNKVKYSDDE